MPLDLFSSASSDAPAVAVREARRLHRAARSNALPTALPVLRRLLVASVLTGMSLPQLHRMRGTVQRKHLLRLLALEAGHADWPAYRNALRQASPQDLLALGVRSRTWSTLNAWFADDVQASRLARAQGGHAVRVGPHTVVLSSTVAQRLLDGQP